MDWASRILLIVSLAWTTGCHHCPPKVEVPPPQRVEVRGAVARPGVQTLPRNGLTLRQAVAEAGGVVAVTDENVHPRAMLVGLSRGGIDYYFSSELVAETACGSIPLVAGDRIPVRPWTETDLFRHLKADPVPDPKKRPTYAPNWDELKALYPAVAAVNGKQVLDVTVSAGPEVFELPKESVTLDFNDENGAPRFGHITTELKIGAADPLVFLVSRRVSNRQERYVLVLRQFDEELGPDGKLVRLRNPTSFIYPNALVLDGDQYLVTLPEALPLVAANRVMRRTPRP